MAFIKQMLTWMVLEMARPTAALLSVSLSPTDSRQVATTMMAPKKSHQKASHRWHCSVLNSARWCSLMRATFSCSQHSAKKDAGGMAQSGSSQARPQPANLSSFCG